MMANGFDDINFLVGLGTSECLIPPKYNIFLAPHEVSSL